MEEVELDLLSQESNCKINTREEAASQLYGIHWCPGSGGKEDVWVGCVSEMASRSIEPGAGLEESCVLLQLGGRYLLAGKECLQQCAHNDLEFRE